MAVKSLNDIYAETGHNLDSSVDSNTLVSAETGTKTFGVFKFFAGIAKFLANGAKKTITGGLEVDSLTVNGSAVATQKCKLTRLTHYNGTSDSNNFYLLKDNGEIYLCINLVTDKIYTKNTVYEITEFSNTIFPMASRAIIFPIFAWGNVYLIELSFRRNMADTAWVLGLINRSDIDLPANSLISYLVTYNSESSVLTS